MKNTTLEKIKMLEQKGLSITEISRLSGVPQPTVWRIAHKKHAHPLESTAQKIDKLYRSEFHLGCSESVSGAA